MLSWEARSSVLPPPCVTGRFSCEAASPWAMLYAQAHHGASSPVPPPPQKHWDVQMGPYVLPLGWATAMGRVRWWLRGIPRTLVPWHPPGHDPAHPVPICAALSGSAATRCWACCIGWGWYPRLGLRFFSWFMGPRCGEDSEADGYAM